MLERVYGCFMTCNVFLAGNSGVSLELQCFTAEIITYIVCECDAPEWPEWNPLIVMVGLCPYQQGEDSKRMMTSYLFLVHTISLLHCAWAPGA